MGALGRSRARARRGASLVEILISIAVVMLLLGLVAESVATSRGAYGQGMSSAAVEALVRRTVDALAMRFTGASAGSVRVDDPAPPPAAGVITWIDWQSVQGYAAGAVLAPKSRLRLELQAGELDDGLDNNGDGMVDECRLVYVPDVLGGGAEIGLAGFVTRYAAGELANGVDDDGDGAVDEPGLVLDWEPVEAGVSGDRGGRLGIELTLERASGTGTRIQRSVGTSVRVRSQ